MANGGQYAVRRTDRLNREAWGAVAVAVEAGEHPTRCAEEISAAASTTPGRFDFHRSGFG